MSLFSLLLVSPINQSTVVKVTSSLSSIHLLTVGWMFFWQAPFSTQLSDAFVCLFKYSRHNQFILPCHIEFDDTITLDHITSISCIICYSLFIWILIRGLGLMFFVSNQNKNEDQNRLEEKINRKISRRSFNVSWIRAFVETVVQKYFFKKVF